MIKDKSNNQLIFLSPTKISYFVGLLVIKGEILYFLEQDVVNKKDQVS